MFSKIFDSIKSLLSKLWDKLRKVLVVILLIAAIIFTAGAAGIALPGFLAIFAVSSPWLAAGLAVLGAFLIDGDYAAEIVADVFEAAGSAASVAAEAIGTVVGSVAGGVASSIFSSPAGIALIGVGAYFLLSNKSAADTVGSFFGSGDDEVVVEEVSDFDDDSFIGVV